MENQEKENKMPEKMEAVCKAVLRLRSQGKEITLLTVSDIAKEAGIGKGTVYDYFKTKEEIIVRALIYEYCIEMGQLEKSILSEKTFRGKIYSAFHWIEHTIESKGTVLRIMQKNPELLGENKSFCELMGLKVQGEDMMPRLCDDILKQGEAEDIIRRPKNQMERDIIIGSIACGLASYVIHPEQYENTLEEAEEVCYQNLLKLLGKNEETR